MQPRGSGLVLWVAQGFGIGRIPVAPGTFGSLVGIGWFALLVWSGNLWAYFLAAVAGIAVSVCLCDRAEKILGKKDPGSVVLDEIIAIPFCFLPWVLTAWAQGGHVMPPVTAFFAGYAWLCTIGVFLLFRLFDVWKPSPIRQLQNLPGGWGVTIDDLLASVYVAIVLAVVLLIRKPAFG